MIILREESFGGIVFNPNNAHELWLDQELFESVKNKETTEKVKEVYQELGVKKPGFKIISLPKLKNEFPFQVLNSPTLADIHITSRCNLRCPHCYVSSTSAGEDMTLVDFRRVLEQCKKAGVFQIALGGGEPTLHPLFGQFLKEIRQSNIVPNTTTNGKKLSWKTAYFLSRYAGATAVSLEGIKEDFEKRRGFPWVELEKSIKKLKIAGVKLVFQITISKNNLFQLEKITDYLIRFEPYGVLFLAYKPQGRGKNYDKPLSSSASQEVDRVIKAVFKNLKNKTKIGCDCCLTPALMSLENSHSFKGCSASRESVAIMTNLKVAPCSFLNNLDEYGDLNKENLLDIWGGEKFNKFRERILSQLSQKKCSSCDFKDICLGGCPEFELVKCA